MGTIEQSIEVNVPVHFAYALLSQFESYPTFMGNVLEVRQRDDGNLYWRGEKKAKKIERETEITERITDKVIAWRTTSGPKNNGRVTLEKIGTEKTRLVLSVERAALLSSESAKTSGELIEQDLQRFKKIIESQHVSDGARGVPHPTSPQEHLCIDSVAISSESGAVTSGDIPPFQGSIGSRPSADASTAQRVRQDELQSLQSSVQTESNMTEQTGSMQYSGNANTGLAAPQSPTAAAAAQLPQRPAQPMAHVAESIGQIPVQMHEQEAGLLQRSMASPQTWLPSVMSAWEGPMLMMRRVSEEMEQFFARIAQRPMAAALHQSDSGSVIAPVWTPTIEVSEREYELLIGVDLPGLTKEEIHLRVLDNKLVIEGERRGEMANQPLQGYHRSERNYGKFYRLIPLPFDVDRDALEATMRKGVLEIRIPLTATQAKDQRLEIRDTDEDELQHVRPQGPDQQGQQDNAPIQQPTPQSGKSQREPSPEARSSASVRPNNKPG